MSISFKKNLAKKLVLGMKLLGLGVEILARYFMNDGLIDISVLKN